MVQILLTSTELNSQEGGGKCFHCLIRVTVFSLFDPSYKLRNQGIYSIVVFGRDKSTLCALLESTCPQTPHHHLYDLTNYFYFDNSKRLSLHEQYKRYLVRNFSKRLANSYSGFYLRSGISFTGITQLQLRKLIQSLVFV